METNDTPIPADPQQAAPVAEPETPPEPAAQQDTTAENESAPVTPEQTVTPAETAPQDSPAVSAEAASAPQQDVPAEHEAAPAVPEQTVTPTETAPQESPAVSSEAASAPQQIVPAEHETAPAVPEQTVTPTETAPQESPAVSAEAASAPQQDVPTEHETAPVIPKAADADETGYTFRSFLCDAADLAESVVTAIFAVMLIFTYLVCTADVEGDSMVPTLENADRLLVSRIGRHYDTGDILILDSESAYLFDPDGRLTACPGVGKDIVKRLIAQSGQEVNIDFDEGIVYVDGKALDEPYTNTLTKRDNRAFTYPLTVPEGYIFVLGDNRHISKDSRHPEVGLIPEDKIVGRVLLRLSPLSKFGRIDSSGGQQTESQRD